MFKKSPFSILGISVYDTKQKIIDAANFPGNSANQDELVHAKSLLINPRSRIHAELAWLPGLSCEKVVDHIISPPITIDRAKSLHAISNLAYTNIICEVFTTGRVIVNTVDDYAEFLILLSLLVESVDAAETIDLINDTREIAGFPKVTNENTVNDALDELYRKHAINTMLIIDALPLSIRAQIFEKVIGRTTFDGTHFPPYFIDLLLDRYEISISHELQIIDTWIAEQATIVKNHLKNKRLALAGHHIDLFIDKMNWWGKLVQSLQVSAKSKHIKHKESDTVAFRCRSFSISICNDLDFPVYSRWLMSGLLKLFIDVPEKFNKFTEDISAIDKILESRREKIVENVYWDESNFDKRQSSSYISFDENFIETNSALMHISNISGIRWWQIEGVCSSSYYIGISSDSEEILISPKLNKEFVEIANYLWTRIAIPIALNIARTLSLGHAIKFESIEVTNFGIRFPAYKDAPAYRKIMVPWGKVSLFCSDKACFYLSDTDETYFARINFSVTNSHVFYALIKLSVEIDSTTFENFFVLTD